MSTPSRQFVRKAIATAAAFAAVALPLAALAADPLGINYGTATGLSTQDVRTVVSRIINVAMGLLGIVTVVIILYGGFQWMIAGGATEKVEEAKKRIFQGVIGLAIILTSYAIARFVVDQLVNVTTAP
ncbi:MAG: pilin [Candidatus Uhrbacteria bacterium]